MENKKLDFEIISMQGRSVIRGTAMPEEKIDLSSLLPGQYIITISEGQRRVVEKLIKQ